MHLRFGETVIAISCTQGSPSVNWCQAGLPAELDVGPLFQSALKTDQCKENPEPHDEKAQWYSRLTMSEISNCQNSQTPRRHININRHSFTSFPSPSILDEAMCTNSCRGDKFSPLKSRWESLFWRSPRTRRICEFIYDQTSFGIGLCCAMAIAGSIDFLAGSRGKTHRYFCTYAVEQLPPRPPPTDRILGRSLEEESRTSPSPEVGLGVWPSLILGFFQGGPHPIYAPFACLVDGFLFGSMDLHAQNSKPPIVFWGSFQPC